MSDLISSHSEYQDQKFKFLVQRAQTLENISFNQCEFGKCDFTETNFQNTRFHDCIFRGCTLNLIQVNGCSFKNALFENTQIVGVDWSQAHWERNPIFRSVDFKNSALNHNTFIGLKLRKMMMKNCSAMNAVFEETDLTDSDLRFTDFNGSRFVNTNLTRANLSGAKNYSISPQHNQLKKTKFSLPEAMTLLYALDIELIDIEWDENV